MTKLCASILEMNSVSNIVTEQDCTNRFSFNTKLTSVNFEISAMNSLSNVVTEHNYTNRFRFDTKVLSINF